MIHRGALNMKFTDMAVSGGNGGTGCSSFGELHVEGDILGL